jgi:hypothetical protein
MLTRGAQVTGVAVCGLCLTWISVTLRFYVRIRILKFIGREDWLTVAAMVWLVCIKITALNRAPVLTVLSDPVLNPLRSPPQVYGLWTGCAY